jgi:hypothetical protein
MSGPCDHPRMALWAEFRDDWAKMTAWQKVWQPVVLIANVIGVGVAMLVTFALLGSLAWLVVDALLAWFR